jgi:hypothetical protein
MHALLRDGVHALRGSASRGHLAEGVLVALAGAVQGDDVGGGAPQVQALHAAREAVLRLEVQVLPQRRAAAWKWHSS